MNSKDTLGNIVSKYPNTISVMNQYKLDYCCGGKDTLELAIENLGLNHMEVVDALKEVIVDQKIDEVIDWKQASYKEIIDHILSTHHVFMRDVLEELNISLFKLLKVHYKTHGESLLKIHKLFGTLKTELEAHLIKEEENLFPMILSYEQSKDPKVKEAIVKFINDTEDEHDAAGNLFKALANETNDYSVPEGACFTYKRAYELLDALEKDTFNHIHMENSILFEMI